MSDSEKFIPEKAYGFRRVVKATSYSLAGIKDAFNGEAAFKQECILCVILVPLAIFMPVDGTLRLLMILSILQVCAFELLNSAIEAMVDKVCIGYDPLAKRAKDMGSAAVFVGLIIMVLVWSTGVYSAFFN